MTKILLITGGTGLIGTQLVKHFSQKKYTIVFLAQKQIEINTLLESLNYPSNVVGFPIDLVDENSTRLLVEKLNKKKLYPTDFIHCARNINYLKNLPDGLVSRANWLGEYTLDVIVPYELVMILVEQVPLNIKNIITISSVYGVVAQNPHLYNDPKQETFINYSVAKAAQIHLTKELAVRLASFDIRVNTISFGGIEGRADENFKKRYATFCPMGRMLKQPEVVGAVDFLVSSHSLGITGHNLIVDGGWTIW